MEDRQGCGPKSDQSGGRNQVSGLGRHTHNGCTEGLEGMSPACIEVSGIEPLEESYMVEALRLWARSGRAVSPWTT